MFKDIPGYEGLYQADEQGNIKSLARKSNRYTEKLLTQQLDKDGYLVCKLRKDNKGKMVRVHRLVATTFIPNPYNKPTVNHIDGVHTNNAVSNLEWATQSEQQLHAIRIGLRQECSNRCKVEQLDKNTLEVLNTFNSLKEAERITGIGWTGISAALRGVRKSAGGYYWRRFND